MININKGYSDELMRHCKPLSDYTEFFYRLREYKRQGYTKEEATEMAIDSCIKDGILETLLRKERAKVTSSLITALTEKEIEQLRKYQLEQASREGLEQGLKQGMQQAVDRLVASGLMNEGKACEVLGVDLKEYISYKNER